MNNPYEEKEELHCPYCDRRIHSIYVNEFGDAQCEDCMRDAGEMDENGFIDGAEDFWTEMTDDEYQKKREEEEKQAYEDMRYEEWRDSQ